LILQDGINFFEITLNNKPLRECELVYSGSKDNNRLYVDKTEGSKSFHAMAVSFASCDACDDWWSSKELTVEKIFELTAHFDGVRHVHFNNEENGYLYYPNMEDLINMFTKVRELELKICPEADK
jgi:hypothetical protein